MLLSSYLHESLKLLQNSKTNKKFSQNIFKKTLMNYIDLNKNFVRSYFNVTDNK